MLQHVGTCAAASSTRMLWTFVLWSFYLQFVWCLLPLAVPQPKLFEIHPHHIVSEQVYQQIQSLVQQRALARWEGDYDQADAIRHSLEQYVELQLADDNCHIVLQDLPRKDGGGSTWKLMYRIHAPESNKTNTILQLAHSALGHAVSCAKRGIMPPVTTTTILLDNIVAQAKEKLVRWNLVKEQIERRKNGPLLTWIQALPANNLSDWMSVETELRGRKSADAAFWFAMAGAADEELFVLLSKVASKELFRFGDRPSTRAKDIMGIAERFAAAGVRDTALRQSLIHSLQAKGCSIDADILDMHSERCALMIWKFSTRQRKQRSFLGNAARHWNQQQIRDTGTDHTHDEGVNLQQTSGFRPWQTLFSNTSCPLVLDLGCGMGVGLLGLASLDTEKCCNYLGVDLSSLAIGYARGIARRWNLDSNVGFEMGAVECLLQNWGYPGPVRQIMIQFPTPYRFLNGGNSQLPASAGEGFMVTEHLLALAYNILAKSGGQLLLQSNCEDVAVTAKNSAVAAGFVATTASEPVVEGKSLTETTQRTRKWINLGGERAIGNEWSAVALLPSRGRTETEIACLVNKIPVHRCRLAPKPKPA